MSRYTGNVQFEVSMVLHKNDNHGKAFDFWYVAHNFTSITNEAA